MRILIFCAIFFVSIFSIELMSNPISIDVKTHLTEKTSLLPIKIGLMTLLGKTEHKVVLVDSDYAVWLKDYKREKNGDIYSIKFTITISEPSTLREKKTLKQKAIEFTYNIVSDEHATLEDPTLDILKKKFQNYTKNGKIEGAIGGKLATDAVVQMLKELQSK